MLIAFTLTAVIMVLLFSALNLATRAWDATEGRSEVVNDRRAVLNFLRRSLRQARPLLWHYEGHPGEELSLLGDEQTLTFVGPPPAWLGARGLQLITYELLPERDGGQFALTVSWQPYRPEVPEPGPRDDSTSEVVIDRVEDLTFAYFGSIQPGDEPDWLEEWDDPQRLPALVSVAITRADEEWPELLVDLHQ